MKSLWYIFFSLVFFASCIESNIEYEFDYKERPITIGFLDTTWGVRAWVGKTSKIIAKDSSTLDGAMAFVHQSNAMVSPLKLLGNNSFILEDKTKIIPGIEYYLTSKNNNFPDQIKSNLAVIPPIVKINKVDVVKIRNGNGKDIFIDFKDPSGFNAYAIYIERFYKDTAFDQNFRTEPFFMPFTNGMFSDREFEGTVHTYRIENFQLEGRINGKNREADSININLFNISKPMFDFFLSINTPEPTTGDPFFDPTIIPATETKGISILCAYSHTSKGVRL